MAVQFVFQARHVLRPDAGEGRCLGLDLRRDSALIKRRVGYMTQRFGLYEVLTIEENLDFVARAYGMDRRRERVQATLQTLGLEARRKQLYLERIAAPQLPDKATEPERLFNITSIAALNLVLLLIGWLMKTGIAEHAPGRKVFAQ